MKKIALIAGPILLLLIAFFVFKTIKGKDSKPILVEEEQSGFITTSIADSPFISLTPTSDGYWLNLEVLQIKDADKLEYELLYETGDGATQGSIGSIDLKGKTTYEKRILLGSESSGHYRYDKGVEKGEITIRLRGGMGRRKYTTKFHLQNKDDQLSSIDKAFSLKGIIPSTNYYITMNTIGAPKSFEGEIEAVYGVFSSGSRQIKSGQLEIAKKQDQSLSLFTLDNNSWEELESEDTDNILSAEASSTGVFLLSESSTTEGTPHN
ncbi:hypothetical protein KKF11_01210 [Patescibacteria group bacterium]|nr:hypothetical protein [Patescibacteria group bacterium]